MDTQKIRVIIADDSVNYRKGLESIIENQVDLELVGVASDGAEAIKLVEQKIPNVAIIDIVMPKIDGIKAASRIKTISPRTEIIIITAYPINNYLNQIDFDVAAFLNKKELRAASLTKSIRKAYMKQTSNP